MQFKYPEILYGLLLLIIPIIVHLFQLRRFQKVPFTNVQFLKHVVLQTRKSSQLKKWLILCVRMLLLSAIIIAFAQPYQSSLQSVKTKIETVLYLDNSFSMQAKGDKGELLKRAVQDIIGSLEEQDEVTVFTNNNDFKNVTKKTLTNELLALEYNSTQLDYDAVILKGKGLFSKESTSLKNLILLSDFQQKEKGLNIIPDSLININLVQLLPVKNTNISIDSLYISNTNASNIELTVSLSQQGDAQNDISVSLFDNDNLIAKTTVNNSDLKGTFTVPVATEINGKITIEDDHLLFDNNLYFNINQRPKINVLSINSAEDNFLKRVYTNDEFSYNATTLDQLNYSEIVQQNLMVLNELDDIPLALINSLNSFEDNGGIILIIPSENITLQSYNQLFTNIDYIKLDSLNTAEKILTSINFSHPIFNDVFENEFTNFQYPKVNTYYSTTSNASPILQFEDGNPFLLQTSGKYVFTAALNLKNSNFNNSPLIVPILYNIGRQSLKLPKLYVTIGEENTFDVNTTMQQDDILKLKADTSEIIPIQRTFSNKVRITTSETPETANTYAITSNTGILEYISYNYNRSESNLNYTDLSAIDKAMVKNSIPQVFDTIKSKTNINELWKWFVIFALVFLIIEMLILKYFK